MADYPSTTTAPITEGSYAEPSGGTRIDRATDGTARGQNFYTGDKQVFHLKHATLNATGVSAIETCYSTYRTTSFTFDWLDGSTYTVLFANPPKKRYLYTLEYTDVEVELVEV